MKYIVMNKRKDGTGDLFNDEYSNLDQAINAATYTWDHLTYGEKKERNVYVLESANPDEEAENHFDGNPVWEAKIREEVIK